MRMHGHGMGKRWLAGVLVICMLVVGTGAGYRVEADGSDGSKAEAGNSRDAKTYRLGDLDRDGSLTLNDCVASLKAALSIVTLDVTERRIGDVNKDGVLDLNDTVISLKAALSIVELDEYVSVEALVLQVDGMNGYGSVLTEDEEIILRGSVYGMETPVSLKYTVDSEAGTKEERSAELKGGSWESDSIPLSVGSNPVTFVLEGENGTVVNEEVIVCRISKQVEASDDVVVFDVEDPKQLDEVKTIREDLQGYSVLDGGEEATQNACELIVDETSPLYRHIKDGDIKPDEIIYIPANEYFPSGLTFRYEKMDDSCESGKAFQSSSQEVIHGQIPSLTELLDGEGCIASDSLDGENPIAFVCGPIGTDLEIGYGSVENYDSSGVKAVFEFGNDSTVRNKGGFQFHNLKQFRFTNELKKEGAGKYVGNIKLGFDNVILYDEDGKGSTKEDRIVLNGSVGLDDIRPVYGCEWSEGSRMPQQLISTLEYTEKANVKATFGGKLLDKKDLLKGLSYEDTQLNDDLNSMQVFGGIEASGVDLSQSIIIGAIGLQMGSVQVGTMRTIQNLSCVTKLNPVMVLTLYVDVNGELATTASISYDYACYVKKGVNVQKKNHKGAFGTCEENNHGRINSNIKDYQINIYDTRAKSKSDRDEAPEGSVSFSADGRAEALAGIGVGAGVMVWGIIPAYVKAGIQLDAEALVHGSAKFHYPYQDDYGEGDVPSFVNSVDVDGDVKIGADVHTVAEASVRLIVAKKDGVIQFEKGLEKTFAAPEFKLAEWELSLANVEGVVHDKKTGAPIEGATVTLTGKKPDLLGKKKVRTAVTDENGAFRLPNCSEGNYVLSVRKDDYEDYENKSYSIVIEPEKTREKEKITLKKKLELKFEMKTETIEFRHTNGVLFYRNQVKYPFFLGDSSVESALNKRYADMIVGFKNDRTGFDSALELESQVSSSLPWFEDVSCEVCNVRGAASVTETYWMWQGGAHPYRSDVTWNYDLSTGEQLSYTDILQGTEEELDKVLKIYYTKYLWKPSAREWPNILSNLKNRTAYALRKDGLCFYYDAAAAFPREEIVIPYTSDDSYVISLSELLP